jgi:ArsR family metal-binding transcriptional regulator
MVQVIEMTHKEKVEMYQLIEKDRLIEMLIEANNVIRNLTPKITLYEPFDKCNCIGMTEVHQINDKFLCGTCGKALNAYR